MPNYSPSQLIDRFACQNKLLVIGNGFDLAANAKTSYRNYFESEYYCSTKNWVENYTNMLRAIGRNTPSLFDDYEESISCWDLLFYLKTKYEDTGKENWFDLEWIIHESLLNNNPHDASWERVLYYFKNDSYQLLSRIRNDNIDYNAILCEYLKAITQGKGFSKHDEEEFYSFLFSELKRFEINFGKYIVDQTSSEEYLKKSKLLVKELVGVEGRENILIDTFNYSKPKVDQWFIRSINGDSDNPIFGINLTADEENQNKYLDRFTKTSRRIHSAVYHEGGTFESREEIIHAIVFGHSLNYMDYDYFSYLFSLLGFDSASTKEMGVIEFVYSIYDKEKAEIIRKEFTGRVYRLLSYYEKSIGIVSNHALINRLYFSNKLIIKELEL